MFLRKALHLRAGDIIDLAGQSFKIILSDDRYNETDNVKIVGQLFGPTEAEVQFVQIVLHKDDLVGITVVTSAYTKPTDEPIEPSWKQFAAGLLKTSRFTTIADATVTCPHCGKEFIDNDDADRALDHLAAHVKAYHPIPAEGSAT